MASMKYIQDEHGRFILFSKSFTHKDVAEGLDIQPKSAGSVSLFDENIQVHGESTTLAIHSNSQDGAAIKRQLDFYDGC